MYEKTRRSGVPQDALTNLSLNSVVGQRNFGSQFPRFDVKRKTTSSY